MCGIAGILNSRGITTDQLDHEILQMISALEHRGPDDSGTWLDIDFGLALGHRRLSIIDLSPEGHQPMTSASGRYIAIYNGEIYNYLEIQKDLISKRHSFRGHSDTEVMLAAFDEFGPKESIKLFNGMFALVVWDRSNKEILLASDRMGKKPIYYGWVGKSFVFASELKALYQLDGFDNEIDRSSVALLMKYNYIPAPYSIFKNIRKLQPSSLVTIPFRSLNDKYPTLPEPERYWSIKEVAENGTLDPFHGSENNIIDNLDSLLSDAVGKRMISDVPLGALLSGGIDSSLVVALMQKQSNRPVKTFTIGFHEKAYDEAPHAKAVAAHLKTDHTEIYVSADDALEVIPLLPQMYDEPYADSSQIPTYLVSKLAREHVVVALSGDGGDEIFGGYLYHSMLPKMWNKISRLPLLLRKLVAGFLLFPTEQSWDRCARSLNVLFPSIYKQRNFGNKVHRVAAIMDSSCPLDFHHGLVSHWKETRHLVNNYEEPSTQFSTPETLPKLNSLNEVMMWLDSITYLPDDVLTKVDRASMSVSLEMRNPLLDYRIIEFSWRLPLSFKIRDNQGKWILRQLLQRYVPKHLFERPKTGFGVPIDSWLRGPIKEWAEALLDEKRLKEEGFFNPDLVRKIWAEHQSGKRNWKSQLWNVLMFQAWHESR